MLSQTDYAQLELRIATMIAERSWRSRLERNTCTVEGGLDMWTQRLWLLPSATVNTRSSFEQSRASGSPRPMSKASLTGRPSAPASALWLQRGTACHQPKLTSDKASCDRHGHIK